MYSLTTHNYLVPWVSLPRSQEVRVSQDHGVEGFDFGSVAGVEGFLEVGIFALPENEVIDQELAVE